MKGCDVSIYFTAHIVVLNSVVFRDIWSYEGGKMYRAMKWNIMIVEGGMYYKFTAWTKHMIQWQLVIEILTNGSL